MSVSKVNCKFYHHGNCNHSCSMRMILPDKKCLLDPLFGDERAAECYFRSKWPKPDAPPPAPKKS